MYQCTISQESKAVETSSKPRAAVAVVVVSLMILGLTNVVLSTYTLTNLHSSKNVKPEVNLTEQGCDDTVNESERKEKFFFHFMHSAPLGLEKGICIILFMQAVEFHLRYRAGTEPDQEQPPDHFADLAAPVDGGVPIQADQL